MNPEDELQIQYEIHSSIDFVEEKLKTGKKDMRELYLGQLYSTEDHKVYPLFAKYIKFDAKGPFFNFFAPRKNVITIYNCIH